MIELLKSIDARKKYTQEFLNKREIPCNRPLTGTEVLEILSEKILERDKKEPPELINYRTIDEFCEFHEVSGKTLERWRKRGLVVRFKDRIVITDEDFAHFQRKNKLEIEQTWKHQPLSDSQKTSVLYVHDRLLKAKCKRPIPIISEVTGRALNTISRAVVDPNVDETDVFFDLQNYPLHLVIRKYRLSEAKAKEIEKNVFLNKIQQLDLRYFDVEDTPQIPQEYGKTLTTDQETYLFSRLSYLKSIASQQRDKGNYNGCWDTYLLCLEVREIIAEKNQPLLVAMRNKAIGRHQVDSEELFGRFQWSLLNCIERFNLNKGLKFSTYLSWSLKNAQGKLIVESQQYNSNHSQLDEDYDGYREETFGLYEEIAQLSETQQQVISLMTGMEGEDNSARQVSEQLGISIARVTDIYETAISKLKHSLEVS